MLLEVYVPHKLHHVMVRQALQDLYLIFQKLESFAILASRARSVNSFPL
jgi:hypothetical protein